MTNLRSSVSEVKSLRPSESFRNLHLLRELVRRDFTMRFTGSAFGLAWAVLQPLTLVCLYWFVFTVMMPRSRAAGTDGYVNFLICGLLPWLGFQEGLMRGTTSIVENAAMVRRLTLKSELLVVVPNISAILFELIGLALFALFLVWDGTSLAGLWILPFALIMQLLLQIGFAWFASVLFVFFRDVAQILGFLLSVIFYLSPILYSVAGRFENFFAWNPMTPLLGLFRSAMLGDPLPQIGSIVFLLTVASVVFTGGLLFFRRAQPTLADLL